MAWNLIDDGHFPEPDDDDGRTSYLIEPPKRLVYLSSGMHLGGDPDFPDLQRRRRRWNGSQAYSDSKLFDTMLAFAVARTRHSARSNAVDPGWVPTRMGWPRRSR